MSIIVVDSIMGSGKSTWIRNFMKRHPEKSWWYVGVSLSEVHVNTIACQELNFQEPSEEKNSKSIDLISLINKGENIGSTRQLFMKIKQTPETLDLIKSKGYSLVIDEVLPELVTSLDKPNDDIVNHLRLNTFSIDENTGHLEWINTDYNGSFNDVRSAAADGHVYYNETTLISVFNPNIFSVYEDIYILTYLFEGSQMKYYFELYGLNYTTSYINNGALSLVKPNNHQIKLSYLNLIEIYDGPLYNIGVTKYTETALSHRWYRRIKNKAAVNKLMANTYNYLHNIIRAKSKDTLFTVFNNVYEKNPYILHGYKKSFVACNTIGTNEYRNRFNLAYLVNMYEVPEIKKFFSMQNIAVNENAYALSTMIQWIFRSRIRNKGEINLFIPSIRMRRMLIEWFRSED